METFVYTGSTGMPVTPATIQRLGSAVHVAKPESPVTGLVALRFNDQAQVCDVIDLAWQFINGFGAVPVKCKDVGNFNQDANVAASINALALKGGQTVVFYLQDMTQLRMLDVETANKNWGPHLQDLCITLNIKLN